MSHYAVAVIHKPEQDIDEMLAPYCEDITYLEEQYIEFEAVDEEEYLQKYKDSASNYSFESFMTNYYGFEIKDGEYGCYCNPNAKWDWYQIGGRFSNMLSLKNGDFADSAMIKDCDFEFTDNDVRGLKRFWELVVENEPLKEGEEKPFTFWKPEYYLEKYKTKDNYVKCMSAFSTYAALTPDGVWNAIGEMGWFACSDDHMSPEEWDLKFVDNFIRPYEKEHMITIVDLHI